MSLTTVLRVIRSFSPVYLSHHPNCRHYRDDVIKIRGMKICGGCFFLYSGLILTILTLFLMGQYRTLDPLKIALVGFCLMMPLVIQTFIHFSSVFLRRCVRFLMGAWAFLLVVIPIKVGGSLWLKIIYLLALVMLLSLIRYHHVANFRKKCLPCIYHGDFSRCTGFREVSERLKKNGCDPSRILKKRNF